MKHLFSLYLSGTEATPSRRQAFVAKLFWSSNPKHNEIAVELLNSALEASHWTSFGTFDFGARRRGSGWRPSTYGDKLDWYHGFIAILSKALQSNDRTQVNMAKKIVSSHFRGLWSFAGCFDALEEVVLTHAKGGVWPNLWIALKNTIHFDGEKHEALLLDRLKALEAMAAPNDPYSEMEAYVLSSTWDHAEVKGGDYSVAVQGVNGGGTIKSMNCQRLSVFRQDCFTGGIEHHNRVTVTRPAGSCRFVSMTRGTRCECGDEGGSCHGAGTGV